MKKIAAAFGMLLAFSLGAFAADQAAPVTQTAVSPASAAAVVSPAGAPVWLPASGFCSGNCNVYCGSGAVDRYYEPSAACCVRDSCQDGSLFLSAMWQPPAGCWGGGECALP
jgi:hypothetical protein